MKKPTLTSRRNFLKTSALSTGGLIISFYIPSGIKHAFAAGPESSKAPLQPNAFIQIAPDNSITMTINKLEMGQGVNTSLAQLIAEELECDWTQIRCVSAPVNPVFNHTAFGAMQMTGGSSALISSWDQHRKIGATMREMLRAAAAKKWGIPAVEVTAESGYMISAKGRLSFGDLADAAAKMEMPSNPPLKTAKDFKIIGKSMKRVDAPDKSNGKAVFGMDVRIKDMLYAVVARPPLAKATLKTMDDKAARASAGVVEVIRFGNRVAVLAKNTHAARVGRDALKIEWDLGESGKITHTSLMADFKKQASDAGVVADNRGDVDSAMKKAKKKITAEFEFPFLAHACMEPMNCTIAFDGSRCEIWSGHQMPTSDRDAAAKILGLKPEEVKVNTVYAGGSFGRRGSKTSDYVVEAAELAKIAKRPLKVVWTREDDMRGGFYRPMTYHRATLGFNGKALTAWDHRIVGQSVIADSMFEQFMVKDGLEATITEGISKTPYELPNFRCEQTRAKTPMTTLWWRSVGHTHTAYVMETLIDQIAEATSQDPLKMRKTLLQKSPRHVAVLELLEKQSNWRKKSVPRGRAWGLAIHESFNSVVGHIAEVSMKNGQPVVHKVWSAVHCGQVVNPEGAKAQIESSIVYGLSAAFSQEIAVDKGQVTTSNFHDFPMMRISEMPEVHVAFVESTDRPTGLGEPGLPPIAPAVANAVYRLTKKRIQRLPFTKGLKA